MRQVDGTTHELVGLTRVNAQTEHSLDGLVEVVGGHALEQSDGLVGGVEVVAIDALSGFAVLLGTLYHLSFSLSVRNRDAHRASGALDDLHAGLDIASRQIFHLDLGDFANLRLGDRADLVGQRVLGALLNASTSSAELQPAGS